MKGKKIVKKKSKCGNSRRKQEENYRQSSLFIKLRWHERAPVAESGGQLVTGVQALLGLPR